MSYRFCKVTTLYPDFINTIASRLGDTADLPYAELMAEFCAEPFGWSDYFTREFQKLGVESMEIFANVEVLQAAWAKEHALATGPDWQERILISQLQDFRPDVLFFEDTALLAAMPRLLSELDRRPRIVAGWRFTPISDPTPLRRLDLLLTGSPNYVEDFRRMGIAAKTLPLAFAPATLDLIPTSDRTLGFTFSGNLGSRQDSHGGRFALIEQLMRLTPLEIWAGDQPHTLPPVRAAGISGAYHANRLLLRAGLPRALRKRLPFIGRATDWRFNPACSPLGRRYPGRVHAAVFGAEYFGLLGRSQLTFNAHIEGMAPYCGNMRLFEATGMGACIVTESAVNLRDYFEPDTEVVTYASAEECAEKVKYLLANAATLKQIARAGQARTLREHTYAQRVKILDELLRSRLSS